MYFVSNVSHLLKTLGGMAISGLCSGVSNVEKYAKKWVVMSNFINKYSILI